MRIRLTRARIAATCAFLLVAGSCAWYLLRPDPGDPRLNAFVKHRPPVPIVFTSRTEPISLIAAAPEGEGFTYPGQRLWAAREGRLRLLTPRGTVHELTWGRQLADGGTLIDVMSPSMSFDGKRIYFSGRKGGDDPGHFRLYEIGVDGKGLRQLTGTSGNDACVAAPPMRWRADGSTMPDDERRAIDYDDVDPVELDVFPRQIAFISSRTPDLGRDHARRSTTLWLLKDDGSKSPGSGNRNNDRWPFLLHGGSIAYSSWSRNREVVSADGKDIQPYREGLACATRPIDQWMAVFQQTTGAHFGMLVKTPVPVWRPRPLFNGRIAFMTTFAGPDDYCAGTLPPLVAVQAAPGTIASAPSAIPRDGKLPSPAASLLYRGPERDETGRRLISGTPSPCPPDAVVFAAAPLDEGQATPTPGRFGLYLANQDWPADGPPSPEQIHMRLLFDDPDLVDAEPVAVYDRNISRVEGPRNPAENATAELRLASGRIYRGPPGSLFSTAIFDQVMQELPGQIADSGQAPIFGPPPRGSIDHLRVWAAHRDRFDDPVKPRIHGEWEYLGPFALTEGAVAGLLPVGAPTVLAGFDKDGKIVQWNTVRDRSGHRASFYAYAGDHYSIVKPAGRPFCTGCHPGHSGLPGNVLDDYRERLK